MNAAPNNRSPVTANTVRTLHQFNSELGRLSIQHMTAAAHSQLLASTDIERLARALNQAATDSGAHQYVVRHVQNFQPAAHPPSERQEPAAPAPARAAERHGPAQSHPNVANMSDRRRGSHPSASNAGEDEASVDHAQSAESGQPGNPNPQRANGSEYINEHVYGKQAALCFSADKTRKHESHTIALDAAKCTGRLVYDWNDKISIQLTRAELPHVAAVIFGLLPSCEYSNHGPEHNKGFKIENQAGKLFVQVRAPQKSFACPIGPADTFRVGALVVRQLRKEHPQLSSMADVILLLRSTYVRLASNADS